MDAANSDTFGPSDPNPPSQSPFSQADSILSRSADAEEAQADSVAVGSKAADRAADKKLPGSSISGRQGSRLREASPNEKGREREGAGVKEGKEGAVEGGTPKENKRQAAGEGAVDAGAVPSGSASSLPDLPSHLKLRLLPRIARRVRRVPAWHCRGMWH